MSPAYQQLQSTFLHLLPRLSRDAWEFLTALSNVGAGDSYRHQPWIFRKIVLPYFLKWLQVIIADKNVMEPIIRDSSLDWTILRFPNIVDKRARNTLRTSLSGKGLKFSITLPDTAKVITRQLTDLTFLRQMPSVSN